MNLEENNRSEYPLERVLVDIFSLALDMREAGFVVHLATGHGEYMEFLRVDIWAEKNARNVYGRAECRGDIAPIITSDIYQVGNCWYDHQDFDCLHRLYDALHALLLERKGAPEINF